MRTDRRLADATWNINLNSLVRRPSFLPEQGTRTCPLSARCFDAHHERTGPVSFFLFDLDVTNTPYNTTQKGTTAQVATKRPHLRSAFRTRVDIMLGPVYPDTPIKRGGQPPPNTGAYAIRSSTSHDPRVHGAIGPTSLEAEPSPPRHELFLLQEGEKKITFEPETRKPSSLLRPRCDTERRLTTI